ncbi:4e3e9b3b-416a-4793-a5c3-e3a073ea57e5 [Sclerotinia trifoliorum]|uniref:4e3e9b3b-416a-4793-a5c3-e3a073ea57e5 n=1 Tax=Sclerotinia trifoliorum TaxID=28548 RepID=A0A8H2VTF9_9HELO|nr:4e3e9b3b-416a-4793-a5c3-e3a073ea57e5 [Sclerotinia trifoliorum]
MVHRYIYGFASVISLRWYECRLEWKSGSCSFCTYIPVHHLSCTLSFTFTSNTSSLITFIMHTSTLTSLVLAFGLASASRTTSHEKSSVWVTEVPDHVRPYAIAHYDAGGCMVGNQLYRFPVTGPSSGYAFSLLSTNAPPSSALGVFPHIHQAHYENFFNLKGRYQLWTEKDGVDETRVLTAGDFGSVPINTTHTFQFLDPDTEMVGVIQPGGFENLFYALANSNWTSASSVTQPPFDPLLVVAASNSSSAPVGYLESFDVYTKPDYVPRSDTINGTAPLNTTWHTGPNTLGAEGSPYYIAKDFGPKYLYDAVGYQIIQPFITPVQSKGEFSMSTITLDRKLSNVTIPTSKYTGHAAFEVLEGMVTVEMEGETLSLIQGDVVFIPGNTTYKYYSTVHFSKFLYVGAGAKAMDTQLIADGASWSSPVWPKYA